MKNNKSVINNLYADQALNSTVNSQNSMNENALASLFLGAKKLSDDLLFAIGIKLGAVDPTGFDLTDVSTLIESAQKLGYTVEVSSAN
jgi:hypothetical protein